MYEDRQLSGLGSRARKRVALVRHKKKVLLEKKKQCKCARSHTKHDGEGRGA